MDELPKEIGSKVLEPRPAVPSRVPRVAIDEVTDAVITTDGAGAIVHLNRAAQSLTGWSQADAVGRAIDEVFRIVERDSNLSIECPAARALREGAVVGLPEGVMIVNRDGTRHPVDDSGTSVRGAIPIYDGEGKVDGSVLVFSDAAERRWLRAESEDALAFAGLVIASLTVPFAILGADLEIRTANDSFYQAFRTSAGEDEERSFRTIGDGRWDPDRLEIWADGVGSGRYDGRDFELEYVSEAEGPRLLTLNGRCLGFLSDRPGSVLVSIKETALDERSNSELIRSEQRYRRLFEAAKDGILVLDAADGLVIDANPFMVKLLGYSLGELLGKQLCQIGLFSDIAASEAAVARLQRDGYIRYDHLPLYSKDGTRIDVEFVSNVYAEGGSNVIQCNIRDITERRNLERMAARQAEDARIANRRKDEFLAMLSHELRNPLASILNAVQIFQLRHEPDSVQQHGREILERQVGFLKHLVDDLLEVSRITTGSFSLHPQRCDAREILGRSIESAQPIIARLGHHLTASTPPGPVWVVGDPDRLEQVVVNLLTNAAKYTDPPGRIALSLHREAAEVVIRVSDTGIGIAPELLPHVFELFTQADRSLERSQGGLGVGLTLVERIVAMHGGQVEARSPGLMQGSEFVVRLPSEAATVVVNPENLAPRSTRVLVVDDNVDYADGIALLLRASGYEVEVVHNGQDALSTAIDTRPDVMVLDIGLPGMDGYEVARRVRQEAGLGDIRIVAVSGYREDPEKHLQGKARFDKYLLKPVLMEELKAHLQPT